MAEKLTFYILNDWRDKMRNLIFKLERTYGSLIYALLVFIPLIVIFFMAWWPLGLISASLYLFLVYREFKKLSLEIYLFDIEIELEYLHFFKIYSEKISLSEINEVEAFYVLGRGGSVILKLKTNIKEIKFDLGGSTMEQVNDLYKLIECFVTLSLNTKITAGESSDKTFERLNKRELIGKITNQKTGFLTYKINKKTSTQ